MSWLIFVILSVVFVTAISLFEKYFLVHYIKDTKDLLTIGVLGFSLISLFLIFFIDFNLTWAILPAAFAGIIHFIGLYFYYQGLSKEEVSVAVPLLSLMGVFILIFSYFLFGEVFTLIEYIGIFTLIIGTFLISMENFSLPKFGQAFFLLILAGFLFAIRSISTNYAMFDLQPLEFVFWMGMGALIPSLFFAFRNFSELKKVKKPVILGIGFIGLISISMMYMLASALQLGTVTLTFTLFQTHIFFVFIIVTIVTYFSPNSFHEKTNRWIILQKAIAISLIFIGSILIL
jgi:drug/metabolite transporter (DMT)-like permease